ncbi:MAG: hypothetical protein IJ593_05465, partial [Lachnospiraceae bacterium]|nr:hypothetical protein [Lachnospiraceae bacterium]
PTDINFATKPDGQLLIGWFIDNGGYLIATYNIPSDMRGDITLRPIWGTPGQKLINYDVYNEATGEYGVFLHEPPYTFTPGTALTLTNPLWVTDPTGRVVANWQIDGKDVYEIPRTRNTDVVVKAIFNNLNKQRIVFDMGGGHLTIPTPSEYTPGTAFALPESTSVVPPTTKKFSHWILKDIEGHTLNGNATEIEVFRYQYVKVIAVYTNATYTINWDLKGGQFVSSFATPSEYTYGTGFVLPAGDKVVPPPLRAFDHWEIDGEEVTNIATDVYGSKTVVAVYSFDYIWFGTYPQNDSEGLRLEPIKWNILS